MITISVFFTLLFVIQIKTQNTFYTGVNLAGLEFGEGAKPGIAGQNYAIPTTQEVDYFVGKGMNIFRLPFLWERLQPQSKGSFTQSYFNYIDSFVDYVTKVKKATVVLDPHNYARYYGALVQGPELADLWTKLANLYKNNNLVIFGLMNEPYDMLTSNWLSAANQAIAAIRQTGATNLILVPGNAWTGAHSWLQNWYDSQGKSNAQVMINIVDPGNNYAYEVHQYFDGNYGGLSSSCVSGSIGSQVMADFTNWARQNKKKAFLGEFAGAANSVCNSAVSDVLRYMKANDDVYIGWTWWAAGPMWGNYMFGIDPSGGRDAPQMQYILPYLTGPISSNPNQPTPTNQPTRQSTPPPTDQPTRQTTPQPTRQTTPQPTRRDSTPQPTPQPTRQTTPQPTRRDSTPQPTYPAGGGGCSAINIFQNGAFQNSYHAYYSWGTYSLSDSAVKYQGGNTIYKLMQGWEGLQIRCPENQPTCLNAADVDTISFQIYTTASKSFSFMVKALVGGSELSTIKYVTAIPNKWTQINIPTSFFKSLKMFSGFQIQDTGNPGYKLYVAGISMKKGCLGSGDPDTPTEEEVTDPPTELPTSSPTAQPTENSETSAPQGCNSKSNTVICPLYTKPVTSTATIVPVNNVGGECNHNKLPSFVSSSSLSLVRINTNDGLQGTFQNIKCGMCVKITGSGSNPLNGTVIGFVTDLCAGCGAGGMNINGNTVKTDVGITWNAIDCPVSSSLQYTFKDSSVNYIKVQVSNSKVPVDSIEIKNPSTGNYVLATRTIGNFFVANSQSLPVTLPVQIRITGVTGEQIIDSIDQISNDNTISGTNSNAQFAGTGVSI